MSVRPASASRRTFIKSAAWATVAASPLGRFAAAQTNQGDSGGQFVDAHVHVWTPDVARYPLAEGVKPEQMEPRSFIPEELFAECRPHGVNRIVLIQRIF